MKFVNFQTDRLKNIGLLSDVEAGIVLKMMAQYASSGNIPDEVPPVSAILFQAIQEDMIYFDERYSARCEINRKVGKMGGRPRKGISKETDGLSKETDGLFEKPKDKDKDKNKDKNKDIIEENISFSDDAKTNEAINRWLAYKKERGQTYKPAGLKAFITRLCNLSGGNGEVALKMVEQSMANNYSGVFPLNNNRVETNTPDMGVVLQDSNNKDYSKGGW